MIPRRYLLLLSPVVGEAAGAAEAAASRCDLRIVHQTDRLSFLAEDASACVPLETGEGAFIGTVFPAQTGGPRLSTVPRGMSHAILASGGKAALTAFWGGYILASDDPHRDTLSVSRDPSGGMPCLMVAEGSLTAMASDPATLLEAGFLRPAVAYSALLHHLIYPDLSTPETCLQGVRELLPGTRIECARGSSTLLPWWTPWDFTDQPLDLPFPELSQRLRRTIDTCVSAWASCAKAALVTLSGGLDSSILASALADADISVIALNMVGETSAGDERAYARQACRHLGIALEEAAFDPDLVDLRLSSAPNRPRPVGTAHMQPLEAAIRWSGRSHNADALFNGMAGDSVFCSVGSALPVADAVLAHQTPRRIWQVTRDVASLADVGIAAVGRQAARMIFHGRRPLCPGGVMPFLSDKARREAAVLERPPWLQPPAGTLPGRAYHVEMIARVQCFVDGFDRWTALPTVAPLLSQPVLELCLKIPTWHWVAGSKNRAVAREAYRSRLPSEVIDRRSKGGPGAMGVTVCLNNLPLVRERLLDGVLAQRGFLNRPALEQALSPETLLRRDGHADILGLVEAEAWIAYWTDRRPAHGVVTVAPAFG